MINKSFIDVYAYFRIKANNLGFAFDLVSKHKDSNLHLITTDAKPVLFIRTEIKMKYSGLKSVILHFIGMPSKQTASGNIHNL